MKQLSVKLIISAGAAYLTLNVFGSNVADITEQKEVTNESLLSVPPFTLTYKLNVVTGVQRK